jgi:hypothetical protein
MTELAKLYSESGQHEEAENGTLPKSRHLAFVKGLVAAHERTR